MPNNNQQGSNVNTAPSSFNWPAIQNGLGAARGVAGGLSSIYGGDYARGGLQLGQQLPYFQQQFPETFNPNSYQNPYAQQGIAGLNAFGKYAQPGMQGYNFVQNVQNGNYPGAISNVQNLTAFGQSQGYIPDSNNFIQQHTGVPPVQYGTEQHPIAGYAPYLNAGLGGYQTIQDLKNHNYLGAGVNGLQTLNSAAQIYNSLYPAATSAISGGSNFLAGGANAAAGGADAAGGAASAGGSTLGTLGTVASYAGLAYSAYNAGKTLLNDDMPAEQRATEVRHQVRDAAASYYTFGLSSLAKLADQKLLGGKITKATDKLDDNKFLSPGNVIADKILGGVIKATGSSKGEYQMTRDKYREFARENKILSPDNKLTLADGTQFDAGVDGDKLKYEDIKDKKGAPETISAADSLVAGLGFKGKQREAMTTLFSKAALSSGDPAANLQLIAKQHGLDGNKIQASLDKQKADNQISDEEYAVWSNQAKNIFGGKGAAPGKPAVGKDGKPVLGKDGKPMMTYSPEVPPTAVGPDGKPVSQLKQPAGADKSQQQIVGALQPNGNQLKQPAGADKTPQQNTAAASGTIQPGEKPTASGHWVGPDGKPVGGIDPGFTLGNRFVPDGPVAGPGQFIGSDGVAHNRTFGTQQMPTHGKIWQNMAYGLPPSQGLSRTDIRQVFSSAAARQQNTYRGG